MVHGGAGGGSPAVDSRRGERINELTQGMRREGGATAQAEDLCLQLTKTHSLERNLRCAKSGLAFRDVPIQGRGEIRGGCPRERHHTCDSATVSGKPQSSTS
jgi:hypothetical protein